MRSVVEDIGLRIHIFVTLVAPAMLRKRHHLVMTGFARLLLSEAFDMRGVTKEHQALVAVAVDHQ